MKAPKFEVSRDAVAHIALPGIALLAVAALIDPFGITNVGSTELAASSSSPADLDVDGLVFRQERILETIPSEWDSDLDGYGDAEELARKTSPINAGVHPTGDSIGMGITARGDRDGLHALVAVYVPDGNYAALNVKLGVLVSRRMEFLRNSYVLTQSRLSFVPGSGPTSQVALLDVRFPRSWVDATGHLTMFATASVPGSGTNQAAAAMDLFNEDGVIVLAMPDPSYVPPQGSGGPPQGRDTLFKPLTLGGDDPPINWSMGEVCAQSAQAVTIGGAVVVHEISSAECQGGWEGACPPDCSSSVGTTFTTVDPVILVGG